MKLLKLKIFKGLEKSKIFQRKIITLFMILILIGMMGCAGSNTTTKKTTNSKTGTTETNTVTKNSGSDSFKGSMKDLMAKAIPLKCTWNANVDGKNANGVAYIKGEQYRTDLSSEDIEMHYISDGKYMYIWNSKQTEGTKINIESMQNIGADAPTESSAQSNLDTLDYEYDYKCTPWTVSASKFNPPTDIKFNGMSQMMDIAANIQNNPCAACEMVPEGENRDRCLANC